ncbi:hypothetical protein F8M41_017958 [Gigaspora margarita]|uniref:Uncharacterized protein n=1 Tax=Gigaspora margarita TaxID=4874 RepID=A0A8H4AMA6_GIGMA|nr:hypothetical protein F8M41_017958 [Gigaspora margarita]
MKSLETDPVPEGTLAEKLDAICGKILSGKCDQVDLLQQYYYLGECLIEIAGSLGGTSQSAMAYDELQNRIRGNKGKEKNKENFQLLVDEAQTVRAQELSEFFNETFAGGA